MRATDHDPDQPSWLPSWMNVDDPSRARLLRWALGAVFVAGLAACVLRSANEPADPVLGGPVVGDTSTTTGPSLAETFGTIAADIVTGTGRVLELCLLHADTPEERGRGLMEVTDLAGYDGMLFSNDTSVENPYVMTDTVMPLTITWWQDGGAFRSGTDMTPCTEAKAPRLPALPRVGPLPLRRRGSAGRVGRRRHRRHGPPPSRRRGLHARLNRRCTRRVHASRR